MSTELAEQKIHAPWVEKMLEAKPKFEELAQIHGKVNWTAEANFAKQLFQKNPMLMECTPISIFNAIVNVGAVGLTLSPAQQYAYLVPRNRKIDGNFISECHLDISYKGLIKLVTETGNCDYARADVVLAKDAEGFVYKGPAAEPEIAITNPFDNDRGAVVGCYAIAKLASGDVLCEIMTEHEIAATEAASKAQYGPWKGPFRNEMIKKSVLKRICKTIPRSDNTGRLSQAISIVNEHEGIDVDQVVSIESKASAEDINRFQQALNDSDSLAMFHLRQTIDEAKYIDLYNSAEKGKKTAVKKLASSLEMQGAETIQSLIDCHESGDTTLAADIIADAGELELIEDLVQPHIMDWIRTDVEA